MMLSTPDENPIRRVPGRDLSQAPVFDSPILVLARVAARDGIFADYN
jgi:hypothetical protein